MKDIQNRTVRTGQPGRDSKKVTATKDKLNRQTEQDCHARTGQRESRTARIGPPG